MAKKQEIQDKRFELYERAHTKEYYAVAKWLSEVTFAPAVLGADQADVWRKIEKLCELYEDALNAERARNAKLERKLRSAMAGKRPEPQPKAEPQAKAEPQPKAVAPVKPEPEKEAAPVQQPKEEPKPAPVEPAPAASAEEAVLQDLILEFGSDKGGKPNG